MTGHVRIHVDIPLDAYGVLARSTKGEVGRLLRTLATRAAMDEIENKRPARKEPRKSTIATQRPPGSDIDAVRRLYWKGWGYQAIADELGIGLSTVYRDITKIKAEPPTDDNPLSYLTSTHPEAS